MSLSITTSNLVKSSVSKPDSVTSGQSVAASELTESGESKPFSDTLDATLGETTSKPVAKDEEVDKASTDAKVIGGELNNGQTSEQFLLSDVGEELEVGGGVVSVKKMSLDDEESSSNALKNSTAQSSEKEGEKNPSQIDSGEQVANKTISESAELLARLDESNRVLKSDQLAQQSDKLQVSAVSTKKHSALSTTTNPSDSSSDSIRDFSTDRTVTNLTQLDGETETPVKEQKKRLDSDKASPALATLTLPQSEIDALASVTKISSDKLSTIDPQSFNSSMGVDSFEVNQPQTIEDGVQLDVADMLQSPKSRLVTMDLDQPEWIPNQTNVSIVEQDSAIAVKQQKNVIQWNTETGIQAHQDVMAQESQQLHVGQGLSNALSGGEKIELTSESLGVLPISTADDTILNEVDPVALQQATSAIKSSNELQWSMQDTQSELMDAQITKPTKPLINSAALTGALNNAQVNSSNTSQLSQAENIAASNLAASATSLEGKLIHPSAQLAELSANTSTVASSSAAQSASLATSAATLGVGSRKQLASEVSDINAASGSASSATTGATQLNMVRAEQAQQMATPQSPLMLSKEHAAEQMSERLQMMMSKNLKHVDIRLDPPELGRMQIRMTLNSDSASVHFTVQNQQTRDMVDHAMPRLREMLSQQGITLSDTSVQQQNSGQQRDAQQTAQGAGQGSGSQSRGLEDADTIADETSTVNVAVRHSSDGISYYA